MVEGFTFKDYNYLLGEIEKNKKELKVEIKELKKELKKTKKIVDQYYALASTKYLMRNGRELTVYELLLTVLDRWDRPTQIVQEVSP